jgi:hypothetical protein
VKIKAMDTKECFALIRKHAFLHFFKNIRYHSLYGAHNATHLGMMITSQSQKIVRDSVKKSCWNTRSSYISSRVLRLQCRETLVPQHVHLFLLLLDMMMLVLVVALRLQLELIQLYDSQGFSFLLLSD